ncbi:hypothetical protein [Spiroplasma endosymbiont of Melieria omissa]|uniref:hypothetical protein n=1 Tax=Spiroplasma endosymbiont of Melieria omissa TaxID=3139324 RepID=UPI003CCB550E
MSEVEKLLTMNYENVCNFLKNKYGCISKKYFSDATMSKKSQGITRGKEGLYIHHIDEDKAILLSTPKWAQKSLFAYQYADRLVYCNLLEHLVLHIKIFEYPHPNKHNFMEVGVGGIYAFIVPELNDIYSGIQYKQPWKQKVTELVLPLKEDYFKCIKKLVELGFSYPLLTSFNHQFGTWNNRNNNKLYEEMKKMGVKQ